MSKAVKTGKWFVQGDEAIAEGAIAAGCRYYAGYPITPASEISEAVGRRMPEVGGIVLQMEDELASIHSVGGASVAGLKAMTVSSGPGRGPRTWAPGCTLVGMAKRFAWRPR